MSNTAAEGVAYANTSYSSCSDQMRVPYMCDNLCSCVQLMKGWEIGILRFLQARFMAEENWKSKDAMPRPQKLERSSNDFVTKGDSLLSRFEMCIKNTGVPVLIIHGEQDTLVPIGNSCRLSAVIQAPLVKVSGCGHTPAEELPELFVAEVSRFVKQHVWTDVSSAELGREQSRGRS